MKYHAKGYTIANLHGDIEDTKRCFLQENKKYSSASLPNTPLMGKGKEIVASTIEANSIKLDCRFSKTT